ncbi:MAG: hypothetical protein LC789_10815 [Actinobacteria bacterium]|nr:hypothetical protein [Actinomycetota bacterium]MCA1720920.1 hypothetical protein [Actinomycetota bacterium]
MKIKMKVKHSSHTQGQGDSPSDIGRCAVTSGVDEQSGAGIHQPNYKQLYRLSTGLPAVGELPQCGACRGWRRSGAAYRTAVLPAPQERLRRRCAAGFASS